MERTRSRVPGPSRSTPCFARGGRHGARGFTLVEMIVSVALFAIVMLIAGSTLLSLVYANRKAQALQSVMNNLNVSLDDMVRNIREGSDYNGSLQCSSNSGGTDDCTGGTTEFYYAPFGDTHSSDTSYDIAYMFNAPGCGTGLICESTTGPTGPWHAITAPEVEIQNLEFYVVGTTPGAGAQPKVVITIQGQAGDQVSTYSTFDIQATAEQRLLNL